MKQIQKPGWRRYEEMIAAGIALALEFKITKVTADDIAARVRCSRPLVVRYLGNETTMRLRIAHAAGVRGVSEVVEQAKKYGVIPSAYE